MNYFYDLPEDIINLINSKVNDIYKLEHKHKLYVINCVIKMYGVFRSEPVIAGYMADEEELIEFLPFFAIEAEEKVLEHTRFFKKYNNIELLKQINFI